MDRVNNEPVESGISIRVFHFPKTDILVPTNRDNMDECTNHFKDGLPENFVYIRPEIYFDSKTEPTLVAKQRVMTAEYQVESHTGYEIDENDRKDVMALCTQFKIGLPKEYRRV